MRLIRKPAALLCAAVILLLSFASCGDKNTVQDKTLNAGAENITGNFNPFYAGSEGDRKVNAQIFRSIQRRGVDNSLINSAGSITYEYVGDTQVKYTVAIRDDLRFSDGSHVTIDDVIFFYYFIADATYDGIYGDFYLNDIAGLKEYYYDDTGYAAKIAEYSSADNPAGQIKKYIEKNYADGIDVKEISGITRVDDYTCTVLFNSRNINAISELNAVIVSKAFYTAEYVKGAADKVKSFTTQTLGCGPYFLSAYDENSHKTELKANPYYYDGSPAFSKLSFTDITGKDAAGMISSSKLDVVSMTADSQTITKLNGSSLKYSISNKDSYISLGINCRTLTDNAARRQIMKMLDIYGVVEENFGSYYTRVYMPLSVRFKEYPEVSGPFYEGVAIPALISTEKSKFTLYCCFEDDTPEYKVASEISNEFKANGMECTVKVCAYDELASAVKSKKADLWLTEIPDGATCDKYDYYHSAGAYNLCGISDPQIDSLTDMIRKSTGFADKKGLVENLLTAVMEQAAVMPLYQLQTVTVYNTETIDESALADIADYDGYDYIIPELY